MEPICYIVGACPPGEIRFAPGRPAFVIAADKGLVHLEAQGIRPDLIVGDFDSLGRVPAGDNILRHPVEKDDTDTMLAVKTALDRGMGTIVFYGCLGGRLDLPAGLRGAVSVFCPDGQALGVTLRGLHYPLEDYTLTSGFPLGVSNQFTGQAASVSVREGTLLVMWDEAREDVLKRI